MRRWSVVVHRELVNHVRGADRSFGGRLPEWLARSFHNDALEHIPESLWPALGPILEQISSLTECLRQYDRKFQPISKDSYLYCTSWAATTLTE